MVENELSDAHRSAAASRNAKITAGITGVPTIVDKSPEVVIYEEIGSEGETNP